MDVQVWSLELTFSTPTFNSLKSSNVIIIIIYSIQIMVINLVTLLIRHNYLKCNELTTLKQICLRPQNTFWLQLVPDTSELLVSVQKC